MSGGLLQGAGLEGLTDPFQPGVRPDPAEEAIGGLIVFENAIAEHVLHASPRHGGTPGPYP
jgi:hypothetical protein